MSKIYKERYEKFIKYRQDNPLFKTTDGVYVEKHHIKPVSFFPEGTPQKEIDKDNVVYLTGREHFIAHCLLAKMYEVGSRKWHKMNKAIDTMNCKSDKHKERYLDSKLYERLKIKYYKQVNKENEEKGLITITEMCDWIDVNGIPITNSKNPIEKQFATKINNLKQKKKGKGNRIIFHESYQELVKSRGYSDLFDNNDNEAITLEYINKLCDYILKNNGKMPSSKSKNDIEKALGQKLSDLKKAKQGKGNGHIFLSSYQELANTRGYPELFDIIDLETKALIDINKICDFIDSNNRVPKNNAKGVEEKRMARKIGTLRKNKIGKASGFFFHSYQKLVEKRGYPNLFEYVKNKKGA